MKKETGISLDMRMTGHVLSDKIRKRGYTVAEIQKELNLSCPQPIYRWFKGQTMPSIDNLYKLSALLEVHMEDLVIPRQDEVWILHRGKNPAEYIRLKKYHKTYRKIRHERNQNSKKVG